MNQRPFVYVEKASTKEKTPNGFFYSIDDSRLSCNGEPMEVGIVCRLEHTAAKVCSALNAQSNLMRAIKESA